MWTLFFARWRTRVIWECTVVEALKFGLGPRVRRSRARVSDGEYLTVDRLQGDSVAQVSM